MSGGWTLRAGHPHARLALTLAERRPAAFEARFGGREGFGFARALDAFAAYVKSETAWWTKEIKAAGIEPE